jgi:tetraacyldisaccharide 4'-kinase
MTHTPAARPLLWPLVPVYRLGLALRELQLRSGLKPIRRLRWPVVSIGNLSTGGAGKTPLTIALVKALTARGLHVDVLSRGYGRRRSAPPLLVDPGGTAQEFGDEPLLIAREAQVPVYVAAERYRGGLLAEANAAREQAIPAGTNHPLGTPAGSEGARAARDTASRPGVHLLDDGFQHRQLARDVDILLLSRRDLADHLLPAGNLREALHAAKRAQVIAIPADEADVEAEIKARCWKAQVWRLRRRMEIPPTDGLVAAFCGIAQPDQFFRGLESAGVKLATRTVFADHHNYTMRDLERLASEARSAEATTLLTTEKDRVRIGALASTLPVSLPLQTAQLRIEIEDESAAIDWLISRLGDPPAANSNKAQSSE